jgi:hypothetical protein
MEIVMIIFIRHGGKNYNLNKFINTEGDTIGKDLMTFFRNLGEVPEDQFPHKVNFSWFTFRKNDYYILFKPLTL